MNTLRLIFGALLAFVLPVVAADEAYEIRIQRPMKAGDRFRVAAKVTVDSDMKTIVKGEDPEEEKTHASCKLLAEYTAVAVTKRGAPSEIRFKIIEAECKEDGQPSNFFKTGDIAHLRLENGEYVTDINGEDPETVQEEVLDALLYVSSEQDATEDEMFGTKEKVKPGAEWPMNAAVLIADWERQGYKGLRAEDMTGGTKFVEMTEVAGKPAVKLRGSFKFEGKDVVVPNLPEGVRARRYNLAVTDELDSPVDVTAMDSKLKMEYKSETDAAGRIEDGGGGMVDAVIKMSLHFTVEMAETPVK